IRYAYAPIVGIAGSAAYGNGYLETRYRPRYPTLEKEMISGLERIVNSGGLMLHNVIAARCVVLHSRSGFPWRCLRAKVRVRASGSVDIESARLRPYCGRTNSSHCYETENRECVYHGATVVAKR